MSNRNNSSGMMHGQGVLEVVEFAYLTQVSVLTLLGNFLVILAFVFGPRSIRTFTNYFVVNLSVSDMLVGCISLPFWIIYRIDPSLISDTLYKAIIPVDVLSGITSILSLAAISLERKLAVRFPCIHIHLTKQVVLVAILATWLIGLVLSTSMYFVPNDPFYIKVYTASIFIIGFLIPLCVIIASYCVIFQASLNMMKSSNEDLSTERELRVAKAIANIIGLFVVSWTPFFVVNMVYVFCGDCEKPKWPIYVSKMMHYTNSMSNFFVYSARNPEFQTFFKKLLCPRLHKQSSGNNIPLTARDQSRKISTVSNESTVTCGSNRSQRFSTNQRLYTISDTEEEPV